MRRQSAVRTPEDVALLYKRAKLSRRLSQRWERKYRVHQSAVITPAGAALQYNRSKLSRRLCQRLQLNHPPINLSRRSCQRLQLNHPPINLSRRLCQRLQLKNPPINLSRLLSQRLSLNTAPAHEALDAKPVGQERPPPHTRSVLLVNPPDTYARPSNVAGPPMHEQARYLSYMNVKALEIPKFNGKQVNPAICNGGNAFNKL